MQRMSSNSISNGANDSDPFIKLLEPPADETPIEREKRLQAEAKAKHVSDEIDAEIEKQKQADKKGPKPFKVLLLGQSESGKSTTLKNFQIMYDFEFFRSERAAWRAVIQLNVVRTIHLILDVLSRTQSSIQASTGSQPSSSSRSPADISNPYLDPALLAVQRRLEPLLEIEKLLTHRLTPEGSGETEPSILHPEKGRNPLKELAINSTAHWKGALSRTRKSSKSSRVSEEKVEGLDPNDPSSILYQCATDMEVLWSNAAVKRMLRKQNTRLEDMAGFFLDSIERVTALNYTPSDDDILRARLKTLGVSEHRFNISSGTVWCVYDVGGHRSLRAAWVPYFDDVDAIIFLAPISCFDQTLDEDSNINRLEDSVKIWVMIVEHKMLSNANIILFLNKVDILRAKLESGIRFSNHVVSYGGRPNDSDSASLYLRKKFGGILKEKSTLPRPFYCHLTTVIDAHATKNIISNVKDLLMRRHLSEAALLS